MKKVSYYPGCTLKTKASNLDQTAVTALGALGVELEELPRWNCCGAVFSLADDNLINLLAPVRDLIRVKEQGETRVLTACSMCYNTLARANQVMRDDEEKRFTINSFMEEEPDYEGDVEVLHLLPFLRDDVGWDTVREKVKVPLTGLKVAPYYGCTLLRPREVAIEPTDRPALFREFIEALGAEAVSFPAAVDCCSSYQMVSNPEEALSSARHVLESAKSHGAEALVSSCPLCEFNLGRKQEAMTRQAAGFEGIPTYYFTQLLAVALGLEEKVCRFELNEPASRELLDSRKFIQSA